MSTQRVIVMPKPSTASVIADHELIDTRPAGFEPGEPAPASRAAAAAAAAALSRRRHEASALWPLLLLAVAWLAWMGYQAHLLNLDRQAWKTAHAQQQQTVDNAARLRQSLDGLAADTQRLADAGNANARALVEELRKRGVTISTASAAAASAPK